MPMEYVHYPNKLWGKWEQQSPLDELDKKEKHHWIHYISQTIKSILKLKILSEDEGITINCITTAIELHQQIIWLQTGSTQVIEVS